MKISQLKLNKLSAISAETILQNTDTVKIKVVSDSMKPVIIPNDFVLFKAKCKKTPHFGDIILCKQKYKGSLMIHRFYMKYKKGNEVYYLTKADTSKKLDDPVPENSFLGVELNRDKRRIINRFKIILSLLFLPICVVKVAKEKWS